VLYLATGVPCDSEMEARIEMHKKTRPESWVVVEEPLNVEATLNEIDESIEVVIFDCLTFWVSNLLLHYQDKESYLETEIITRVSQVVSIALNIKSQVIIISNEVGMGIVPETPLGRVFRDILGKSNQLVKDGAEEVLFMVAGMPIKIK
jgi:adenosylcobinamide kinase/adenosylcobinamide-phosphate guanylyltransferase